MNFSARKLLEEQGTLSSIEVESIHQIEPQLMVISFVIDHKRYIDTFNVDTFQADVLRKRLPIEGSQKVIFSCTKDDSSDADGHPRVTYAGLEPEKA